MLTRSKVIENSAGALVAIPKVKVLIQRTIAILQQKLIHLGFILHTFNSKF